MEGSKPFSEVLWKAFQTTDSRYFVSVSNLRAAAESAYLALDLNELQRLLADVLTYPCTEEQETCRVLVAVWILYQKGIDLSEHMALLFPQKEVEEGQKETPWDGSPYE